MNKLIKKSSKIIGGTALAGFGFSFGRNIYRAGKKNIGKIAIFLTALFAILGVYTGGLYLARNYRTLLGSIGMRIAGVIILLPSVVITTFTLWFIAIVIAAFQPYQFNLNTRYLYIHPTHDEQMVRLPSNEQANPFPIRLEDGRLVFGSTQIFVGASATALIVLIGFAAGMGQRATRAKIWKIEEENLEFLDRHKLSETKTGKLFNESENLTFRIEDMDTNRITLFPEGKRGKRAYIKMDEDGRYVEYTSIVKI
jgi:hypothetical protein